MQRLKSKTIYPSAFPAALIAGLESLKSKSPSELNRTTDFIRSILERDDPDILDRSALLDFSVSSEEYWYEKDAFLALVINAMKFAGSGVLNEIAAELQKRSR